MILFLYLLWAVSVLVFMLYTTYLIWETHEIVSKKQAPIDYGGQIEETLQWVQFISKFQVGGVKSPTPHPRTYKRIGKGNKKAA